MTEASLTLVLLRLCCRTCSQLMCYLKPVLTKSRQSSTLVKVTPHMPCQFFAGPAIQAICFPQDPCKILGLLDLVQHWSDVFSKQMWLVQVPGRRLTTSSAFMAAATK